MQKHKMGNEKGFTMIELIMVIVILGILAAVAVPKFVDMKSEAEVARADGVFAAAQATASTNFASNAVKGTASYITTGANLLTTMDTAPDGWISSGTSICIDEDSSTDCTGDTYVITISTVESSGVKAKLTKAW